MSSLRTLLRWSQLQILTKDRHEAVLQVFESLEEAEAHVNMEFLRGLGMREEAAQKALLRLEEFDAERAEAELVKHGVELLTIRDDRYPSRLREIGDAPPFLYVKGDLSILDQPTIGLVGTRQMSNYGRRVTEEFVAPLVHAGMVTVSGLASGVDALVAEETMKAGGKTVAVLGHGLSMIYPKANQKLSQRILEKGGLLVSEFPMGFPPDTYTFPARNRIIAGLSIGTLVLEAPKESGALITAELALEYSREVFAVPGQIFDPNAEGSNRLIAKNKAKLAMEPSFVLRELGIVAPEQSDAPAYAPQNPDEEALLKALTTMPQPMDDLVQKSGLPAGTIGAVLTVLELSGAVKNVGGGMWVKN